MNKTFELTRKHVILLRNAYIRWEDCEFGAPAIDCKRPYGNSSVVEDIAELLEIDPDVVNGWDNEPEYSHELQEELCALHYETKTALQIILTTGSFEPGVFENKAKYGIKWERVLGP